MCERVCGRLLTFLQFIMCLFHFSRHLQKTNFFSGESYHYQKYYWQHQTWQGTAYKIKYMENKVVTYFYDDDEGDVFIVIFFVTLHG